MPRIRTVKPEFWSDEKLGPMPAVTRLVFLGLIGMADDYGRLVDNVKSIDGFIFPETDDSARESLDLLARADRILRYTSASGQRLIQIVHWHHQKVDHPGKEVLPAPSELDRERLATASRMARETIARDSRSDLVPRTEDQGPGTDDPRTRSNVFVESVNSTPARADAPPSCDVLDLTPQEPATPLAPTNRNGAPTVPGTALVVATPAITPRRPRDVATVKAHLASVLANVQAGVQVRLAKHEERRVQSEIVFAYWSAKMDKPRALFDAKRERRLIARLDENKGDVSELLYAIDGALNDAHLMGENDRSRKYDGIETIFRERGQVERLAETRRKYRDREPHPILVQFAEALGNPTDSPHAEATP